MKIISSIEKTRLFIKQAKLHKKSIACVATMGNLHEGHISLVRKAKLIADIVVVTIYINPMQFAAHEDLAIYPKTFEQDKAKLEKLDVDMLFFPTDSIMYPDGKDDHVQIKVNAFDHMHCGISRPQFFTGIATVVAKLFNIIEPDFAVFGEKDFQQLCVIKKLTKDLMFHVKIIGVPTVREESGLAMSSRNHFLSPSEKNTATFLYKELSNTADQLKQGNTDCVKLEQDAVNRIKNYGLVPDYFNIVSSQTLQKALPNENSLVILAACTLNSVRLIDNIQVNRKTKIQL